ncbi:MAG: thioredoxin fold domain-containing protein [Bacteroidota bacterium]
MALFVLFLSLLPTLQGGPDVEWATLPEALSEAQTTQQPTLVYVQAAWCGPCRQLERETFSDARVQERLAQFSAAKLTFDDRDTKHRIGPYRLSEAEWSKRLGAASTPTLVVLSPDGGVLGSHTGFLPPDGLLPILDAALAAPAD